MMDWKLLKEKMDDVRWDKLLDSNSSLFEEAVYALIPGLSIFTKPFPFRMGLKPPYVFFTFFRTSRLTSKLKSR